MTDSHGLRAGASARRWRSAVVVVAAAIQGALISCGGGGGAPAPSVVKLDPDVEALGLDPSTAAVLQAQLGASEVVDAAARALDELAGAVPPDDLAPALVARLRSDPRVATVDDYDGSIIATTQGGGVFSVFTERESLGRGGWAAAARSWASRSAAAAAPSDPPYLVCSDSMVPPTREACLIHAFAGMTNYADRGPRTQADLLASVAAALELSGFTVHNYELQSIDDIVRLRAALPSCGVAFITSHGGWGGIFAAGSVPHGNTVATELPLTRGAQLELFDAFREDTVKLLFGDVTVGDDTPGTVAGTYLGLAPAFFATLPENALVYVEACKSAYVPPDLHPGDQRLAEALENRIVLGWDTKSTTDTSFPAAEAFFHALSPHDAPVETFALEVVKVIDPSITAHALGSATVSPARDGVQLYLTKSTGRTLSQGITAPTNASGETSIGGLGGYLIPGEPYPEWITVTAGRGDNLPNVARALHADPYLSEVRVDEQGKKSTPISHLAAKAAGINPLYYNLSCTNPKLTQTAEEACPADSGSPHLVARSVSALDLGEVCPAPAPPPLPSGNGDGHTEMTCNGVSNQDHFGIQISDPGTIAILAYSLMPILSAQGTWDGHTLTVSGPALEWPEWAVTGQASWDGTSWTLSLRYQDALDGRDLTYQGTLAYDAGGTSFHGEGTLSGRGPDWNTGAMDAQCSGRWIVP